MSVLRADGLSVSFGLNRVLHDVDLEAVSGEIVAVMGRVDRGSRRCCTVWRVCCGPMPAKCIWKDSASTASVSDLAAGCGCSGWVSSSNSVT